MVHTVLQRALSHFPEHLEVVLVVGYIEHSVVERSTDFAFHTVLVVNLVVEHSNSQLEGCTLVVDLGLRVGAYWHAGHTAIGCVC